MRNKCLLLSTFYIFKNPTEPLNLKCIGGWTSMSGDETEAKAQKGRNTQPWRALSIRIRGMHYMGVTWYSSTYDVLDPRSLTIYV